MSEATSEGLHNLFTPERTPSEPLFASDNPPTPIPSSIEESSDSEARLVSKIPYVEPPVLSPRTKLHYKSLPPEFVPLGTEFDSAKIDKIVGEYRQGTDLDYFVRFQDEIIHRMPSSWVTTNFGDLVTQYNQEKQAGTLEPFSPDDKGVHPNSRVTLKITVPPRQAISYAPTMPKEPANRIRVEETVPDSEEESASDGSSEAEGDWDRNTRKSSRTKKTAVKPLPFSPRKTRAKKGFTLVESDGDSDIVELAPPTRKSTRSTKGTSSKHQDANDYEDIESEEDGSDFDGGSSRRRGKVVQKAKKRPSRGQASRPAYGRVRAVDDLAGDALSDEETAPLRAHREVCEKCHRGPAAQLIKAESKRKGKGRKRRGSEGDEDEGSLLEQLERLGGWVRCLKCPVVAHWGCLASTQQDEIKKAIQGQDRLKAEKEQNDNDPTNAAPIVVRRRDRLTPEETTEFICGSCLKGGFCMGCMEVALTPDAFAKPMEAAPIQVNGDAQMLDGTKRSVESDAGVSKELLFRCFTCKRLAHYEHLPIPSEYNQQSLNSVSLAEHYQNATEWKCADCASFTFQLDKILAWRPYPPNAVEPGPLNGKSSHTHNLPREYLVKWLDKSYRRTQWVPHMWLASTHAAKLKNFLSVGPKVELLPSAVPDENIPAEAGPKKDTEPSPFEIIVDSEQAKDQVTTLNASLLDPAPDAERRIPLPWKTIDRVLDVVLLPGPKTHAKGKSTVMKRAVSSDEGGHNDEIEAEIQSIFIDGEQPANHLTETVAEWEARTRRDISTADIQHVVWAFIKWDDLSYEEATWDSPPRPGKFGYSAFETAFARFVESRKVKVPKKATTNIKNRPTDMYKRKYALDREKGQQPDLGQDKALTLMPFQIDGFNWLCDNWWRLQHCILADEMGLGKTVQIVTFLGTIMRRWNAFPALVVVPNSTITNWVREFEKWAPNLRVVPFYGESKSRAIIKKFELEHETKEAGYITAKFHVLVTTYETLTNTKDFTPVFKSIPRWEVLVVDEGQRLKSDSSLLFRKLNELHTEHRIIMTGTPLNNNMRELFNLMNFLDPNEWRDLEGLQKEHEVLTEELIKQLHERLRPYFLRRIKSEVLQLPPKNEVIVPVSMAPLQKEVYRSVLSKNFTMLKTLTHPGNGKMQTSGKLNNILMQLRKCLQHPYLIDEDIEPRGLAAQEAHLKLIDASAKLRLLRILLPQLRARGHRVLLFSQFVIALDVIEDFLNGEGMKYLRLDGNTKQADRQKGMDAFNKPDSDIFIYILSTRAGGVGINLWSADTVIIFDPDFNPHQDLQAIARAYRYGQKKTCLVFKFMVKDSAEERIMQTGKKKLVLDHLIVQKMDEEDSAGDDVQSILTYGAKALFEEEGQGSHDIIYSENDIEKLIEKTETEGDQVEAEKKDGLSFSFAKIWTAEKDDLEEMPDEPINGHEADDSWAQTLARIAAENAKIQAQEKTGRGVRRKAAAQAMMIDTLDSPENGKGKQKSHKSKSVISNESDRYDSLPDVSNSDSDSGYGAEKELRDLAQAVERKRKNQFDGPSQFESSAASRHALGHAAEQLDDVDVCSMCGINHAGKPCYMTADSERLVEYRKMLMDPECGPIETRQAAIAVIDETLFERQQMYLIDGQPLHLLDIKPPVPKPLKRPKPDAIAPIAPNFPLNDSMAANPSSSSKRVSSPVQTEEPSVKKAKVSSNHKLCVICGLAPFHLVKDCSVVARGPASVAAVIKQLQDDPMQQHTVSVLSKILRKQKRQEEMVIDD